MYEALFGAVPFTAGTVSLAFILTPARRSESQDVRQNSRHPNPSLDWKTHLSFPKDVVSPLAVDFIKALLCEPEDRLGFLPGEDLAADGIQQLQQHAWFAGLDWDTLHLQTPPYRPNLLSDDDTRHFDKDIPNEVGVESLADVSPSPPRLVRCACATRCSRTSTTGRRSWP